MVVSYSERWHEEIEVFQAILAGFELVEEEKWGKPCYLAAGANVVIIQPFKDYVALGFFEGALMSDPEGVLVQLGRVQAARVMKFTSVAGIRAGEATIRAYLSEAIALAKAGRKVESRPLELPAPEELIARFETDPELQEAFDRLTPGRQRGYLLHFSDAKQPATRNARIEKARAAILSGRGLLDRH